MKLHFYIDSDDEAERCKEAIQLGRSIAIGGTDSFTGRIRTYTGVVLAVDTAHREAPGERWLITIDTR